MSKLWSFAALAAGAVVTGVALTGGAERPAVEPEAAPLVATGEARAYHAARVYADPAAAPVEDAWLVVRDGKVLEVVDDAAALPPFIEVVELGDEVLFPGLVAADSTVTGVQGQGDHALGAHRKAIDSYDPWRDWSAALRRGVTTVYLSPARSRLIGGVGAVVKTAGDAPVLRDGADLRVNLTPAAYNPPTFFRPPVPPTSESPLLPAEVQPASSRAGALMVLREQAAAARKMGDGFDAHLGALAAYLEGKGTLRVAADSEGELRGALEIARAWGLPLLIEGGLEASEVLRSDAAASLLFRVPLFERLGDRGLAWTGPAPDALRGLGQRTVAVCAGEGRWYWLLEAAAAAVGLGLEDGAARAAISASAADALGVGDRVGRLQPGFDADFVVLNDDPLAPGASVRRVYVDGELAWNGDRAAKADGGVVVRAGTVWTGDGAPLTGGAEVLLRDGKVVAVGRSVPRPDGARVVDAGSGAHLTPGYIDARGSLGVGNRVDDSALLGLLGAGSRWKPDWSSVARAGVTTMVVAPNSYSRTGTRAQAVKTAATTPGEAYLAGSDLVYFDVRGGDHANRAADLRGVLEGGKRYAEQWKKHRAEYAKWQEESGKKGGDERAAREAELRKRLAQGAAAKQEAEKEEEVVEEAAEEEVVEKEVDPINGLWEATIEHEMLPEPIEVFMRMHHEGTRLIVMLSSPMDPSGSEEEIEGTYEDGRIHVEIPTEMGTVMIDGEIDSPDHMVINVVLEGMISIEFEAVRTEVEEEGAAFEMPKKRKKKDDGPAEPKKDWRNEGLRALYEGRAVALVAADRADEIRTAVELFSEYGLPIQLLGAADGPEVVELLREKGVGVVVSSDLIWSEDGAEFVPAARFHELGLNTAFRSDSSNGARFLPQALALATRYGLGPDQALHGLTAGAADLLGIEDRVGRLRPGLDADLIIHSGPPFDLRSRVLQVFVNGREVPQE